MTELPLTLRRWTRHEYERLVDLGLFQRDPVELIGGQLVVAEPQGSYHATALGADAIHANPRRQTVALTFWNVIGGSHGRFALRSESDE